MNKTIVIVDYGVGNVRSIKNALERLGYDCTVTADSRKLNRAGALVLPGVGAFAEGMRNLEERNLVAALRKAVLTDRKPCLGICLGMQLFADSSEEDGTHIGLGWIPGAVIRLQEGGGVRIPHVGWNTLSRGKRAPLFANAKDGARFYFDHSFYFDCAQRYVAATCTYGTSFPAAIQQGNICGVQFHPEKSQANGLRVFRSFFSSYGF